MTPRRIVAALAIGLLAAPVARAQALTGTIAGTVTSDEGSGLADVTVIVQDQATGLRRTSTTDRAGRYAIPNLPLSGDYEVRAERTGFGVVERRNVALVPNKITPLDFTLKFVTQETVLVLAPTPSLDTAESTIQQVVSERLVHALPLPGRGFVQLASLAAGFTGNPSFPNAQGQIFWTNNVLVDGASHFSKWRSAPRSFYSGYGLESIKQVQVLTNRFSAEFGESLAAVTSAVTKAGTNQFRGTGLFQLQDDAMNAPPVFAPTKPPSSSQQFGITLGGPLIKDRTHFFGSYEGRRSRNRNIVVSPAAFEATVPDDEDEHLAFFRVDHQISGQHAMTARYNGQRFRWHNEPGGLSLPGTGTSFVNDVHTALFTDAQQLTPQLGNELRAQFARFIDVRRDLQPSVYVSRSGYSIQGGTYGAPGFGADPEDTWEAADTLAYRRGPHALRMGGGLKYVRAHNYFLNAGYGAYVFAGAPSVSPRPILFMQGLAPTDASTIADPRSVSGFGFLQEDWRVEPRLTLNLGLRYDVEDVRDVRNFNVPVDKGNLQPRFGAVWDPTGSGRTVVRGGAGLYTQQHLLFYINRVQLEGPDGTVTLSLSPDSPFFPTYPNTLTYAQVSSALPARDIVRVDSTFKNPYSVQATAGVERSFFGGLIIAADYVYLRGRDLMSIVDANAPASNIKPNTRSVAAADATRPIVPVPNGYRKIITLGNLGQSWYHGLQVKANRPVGRLQTMVSYTLSSAEDMANYQLPEDSRNLPAEKARANADVTHNVAVGLAWQLPGERPLFANWSLSGIGIFRSDRPYDITWGDDRNGTTQNDARPGGRNTATTDSFQNIDLALTRRFSYGARAIEGRIEAFNLLNTTNYNEYVGALLSGLFARPVSAFPKRRVQLGVIVRF